MQINDAINDVCIYKILLLSIIYIFLIYIFFSRLIPNKININNK